MFASKSTRIASTWPCDFNHRRVVEVRSRYNGNDSEVHLGVCARVDLLAERSVCFRCPADETNRLGSGRQRPGTRSFLLPRPTSANPANGSRRDLLSGHALQRTASLLRPKGSVALYERSCRKQSGSSSRGTNPRHFAKETCQST